MANVGIISTAKGEQFTNAHVLSIARADAGYFVLSGCDVNQAGTPAVSVVVDSGYAQCGWGTARKTVAGGTVTLTAANATLPRLDVIYADINGTVGSYTGTPTAVSPADKTDFKQMATPAPGTNIPAGVILALVYVDSVASGNSVVINADINDIASYGSYCVESPTSMTAGKVPYWSSTAKTLSDGYAVGATANCLVQLNGSAALPAVSGANLTGVLLSGTKLDALATPDDNTTLDATTSLHGLMPKFPNAGKQALIGDKTWRTITWGVDFEFGDGSAVLTAQAKTSRCGVNACKITKAYIRSIDTSGALKTGSVTCNIYVHDYNAAIGSSVDSYAISSASSYEETTATGGTHLPITVAAGKYVTVVLSGIATVTQIVLSLEFEAT